MVAVVISIAQNMRIVNRHIFISGSKSIGGVILGKAIRNTRDYRYISVSELALTPHYQITLTKKGRMDAISIAVEGRAESVHTDTEKVAKAVAHHIKAKIGISSVVEVKPAGGIPRSMGKVVRVVDKR